LIVLLVIFDDDEVLAELLDFDELLDDDDFDEVTGLTVDEVAFLVEEDEVTFLVLDADVALLLLVVALATVALPRTH
jgi:hypothetical protein